MNTATMIKGRVNHEHRGTECLLNAFCGLFDSETTTKISIDKNLNDVLNDTGSGPVSKGMIFLELVSSFIRRNHVSAIKSLDLSKDAPVSSFINNGEISEEDKAAITIKCLGVSKLDKNLENNFPERYKTFRWVMADIYDRVCDGSFFRKNHRALLPYLMSCANKCKKKRSEEGASHE